MFWNRRQRASSRVRFRRRFSGTVSCHSRPHPPALRGSKPLGGTPCGLGHGVRIALPMRKPHLPAVRLALPASVGTRDPRSSRRGREAATSIPTPPADRGHWADAVPRSPWLPRWKRPSSWHASMLPCRARRTGRYLRGARYRTCLACGPPLPRTVRSAERAPYWLHTRCITARPAYPRDALRTSTLAWETHCPRSRFRSRQMQVQPVKNMWNLRILCDFCWKNRDDSRLCTVCAAE